MADEVCANCGKAAVDNIKLKKCACNLVKYCSVDCQKNHRSQHKKACKKRLAELRHDKLFTQPDESCYGECPICCLPLSIEREKLLTNSCCSKWICDGCSYANQLREIEQGLDQRCAYCREPVPKTDQEEENNVTKRAKANDPVAIAELGNRCDHEGDYEGAFEYYTKAAGLGNMNAHHNLSVMYSEGQGVERDLKKKIYHLEEAAIGGHPSARHNLGLQEMENRRIYRAMKHFIIAAKQGENDSLRAVKTYFAHGFVSKEDYEATVREHQAAVDATKSQPRDAAAAAFALAK